MTREQIISAIEAHAARNNIAPATVTSRIVGNSRLYARLKAGGDCTLEIAQKIIDATSVSDRGEDAA
jgi:hypothetical protein